MIVRLRTVDGDACGIYEFFIYIVDSLRNQLQERCVLPYYVAVTAAFFQIAIEGHA